MRQKIGVIFGGKSVEHEISIITATQAMENIDRNLYDVLPIYISKDNKLYADYSYLNIDVFQDLNKVTNPVNEVYLEKGNNNVIVKRAKGNVFRKNIVSEIDILFLIVHGTNVEDGTLSGFANMFDVPIVGPSVVSGAIGQDKAIMKDILKANGIQQTKYLWFYDNQDEAYINDMIKKHLGYPVIIKPATLGSSIGITVCNNEAELSTKLAESFAFDQKVVIEEFLTDFQELNISIRGTYKDIHLSLIEEVTKNDEILSYQDKYLSGSKKTKVQGMASLARQIPANIDEAIKNQLETASEKAYLCLNAQGVIRIDFILKDNQVYLNEVNNIPGSLAYYLWETPEYKYKDLINDLIQTAIKAFFDKKQKTYSIDTNVLSMRGKKNGK